MKDREPAKKPVGAHFLFLMDDLPRRPHRSQSARAKYDRSLANTNLSRYHDAAHRSDTPVRGKRHFSTPRTHDFRARQEVPRCRSSHGQPVDQLWNNLEPKVEAAPIVPQRRAAPFRRSASVGAIPSEPPATARDERPRGRRHSFDGRSNTSTSHLLCGSLMPMREAPVERPEPPPLPKSKWRPGIRMFPERQRCSSVEAPRSGLMMVKPQPHWRSVTERQQDGMTSVRPSRRSAESRSMETSPRRVGRSRSCTPAPRDFDIISGLRR